VDSATCTCSRIEREVLDMVKCWPGIPAIVTYDEERGWHVSTSPHDIERRAKEVAEASCHRFGHSARGDDKTDRGA
jgi:hypothetical protein